MHKTKAKEKQMNITSKTLMTMAAAMAITLTGWAKTLPGVAPMAPDQLAQWRAEETLVNAPKAAAKSDLAFYTGKPYDADLNAYVFPFRNYNPDLCRWTVADPSGFPDGANNYCYAPTPNMGCDPLGLRIKVNFSETVEYVDLADGDVGLFERIPTIKHPTVVGGEYEFNISLVIKVEKDLRELKNCSIGENFSYAEHFLNSGTMDGGVYSDSIVKESVLAHEQGHKSAYNEFVKTPFLAHCASNIDPTDIETINAAIAYEMRLCHTSQYLQADVERSNAGSRGAMVYSDTTKKLIAQGRYSSWLMVAE
jgi:RHS repeat-associated protein